MVWREKKKCDKLKERPGGRGDISIWLEEFLELKLPPPSHQNADYAPVPNHEWFIPMLMRRGA